MENEKQSRAEYMREYRSRPEQQLKQAEKSIERMERGLIAAREYADGLRMVVEKRKKTKAE